MSATLSRCAARSKSHQSVYEIVTDRILEALEKGVIPWRRPWRGEQAAPRSAATGRAYRGINAFLLALQADAAGYESPYWLTFRQSESLGGHVCACAGCRSGRARLGYRRWRRHAGYGKASAGRRASPVRR